MPLHFIVVLVICKYEFDDIDCFVETLPVLFIVHAVVTSSDLKFDRTDLDFGHCTIHESTVIPIKLTNQSLLPQEFGFMNCPEVSVSSITDLNTYIPMYVSFCLYSWSVIQVQ